MLRDLRPFCICPTCACTTLCGCIVHTCGPVWVHRPPPLLEAKKPLAWPTMTDNFGAGLFSNLSNLPGAEVVGGGGLIWQRQGLFSPVSRWGGRRNSWKTGGGWISTSFDNWAIGQVLPRESEWARKGGNKLVTSCLQPSLGQGGPGHSRCKRHADRVRPLVIFWLPRSNTLALVLVLSDLGDSFLVTLAPLPPASQSSPIVRPSCPWSLANTNKSPHQRPCLQFKVICAISQCGCLAEQPLIGTSPRRETVTVRQGPNQLQRFRNDQDMSYKSED